MQSYLFCFPLETKARDFDSRLYLSLRLLNKFKNARCLIGSKKSVHEKMFEMDAIPIYFAKGINPNQETIDRLKKVKLLGGINIYLDEEGGPSKLNPRVFLMRYHKKPMKYIDCILAWGKDQKEILKSSGGINSRKIIVSGHPRFDLRKPKFFSLYKNIQNNSFGRKFILFNMNFGLCNSHFDFDEQLSRIKIIYKERDQKFDLTLFKEHYKYQESTLKEYIKAIRRISNSFPEYEIIVRPHPSENVQTYIGLLGDLSNIRFKQDGIAHELIINAELIIHHDCTTAIESTFAKKPVVSFRPIKARKKVFEEFINQIPLQVSIQIQRVEALEDLINDLPVEANKLSSKTLSSLKGSFNNLDSSSSDIIIHKVDSLIEELEQRNKGLKKQNAKHNRLYTHFIKWNTMIRKDAFLFQKKVGNEKFKQRGRSKFPGISLEEIQYRIKLISIVEPLKPIGIMELCQNGFLIERR